MRKYLLIGLVVLATSLFSVALAMAQEVEDPSAPDVKTKAQIVTGGIPGPAIPWKFELPDMDPLTPAFEYVKNGASDDDPTEGPGLSPSATFLPDGTDDMMSVAPNLNDKPTERMIAYFLVVERAPSLDSILDVYVDVYHPDTFDGRFEGNLFGFEPGSLKYQLHGTPNFDRVSPTNPLVPFAGGEFHNVFYPTQGTCSDALGDRNGTDKTKPLGAALNTGQIPSTLAAQTLWDNVCIKKQWLVFRMVGPLSKHQPAGDYKVVGTAQSLYNISHITNYFDVLSIVGLVKDFAKIDWGNIVPLAPQYLRGDFNIAFDTDGKPIVDGRPTVYNTGNNNMYVGVSYSQMTGTLVGNNKVIDIFDAQLQAKGNDGIVRLKEKPEWQTTASAPYPVKCFNKVPIGSNQPGQIDFSIHPDVPPPDNYAGKAWIVGFEGECPAGTYDVATEQ